MGDESKHKFKKDMIRFNIENANRKPVKRAYQYNLRDQERKNSSLESKTGQRVINQTKVKFFNTRESHEDSAIQIINHDNLNQSMRQTKNNNMMLKTYNTGMHRSTKNKDIEQQILTLKRQANKSEFGNDQQKSEDDIFVPNFKRPRNVKLGQDRED